MLFTTGYSLCYIQYRYTMSQMYKLLKTYKEDNTKTVVYGDEELFTAGFKAAIDLIDSYERDKLDRTTRAGRLSLTEWLEGWVK